MMAALGAATRTSARRTRIRSPTAVGLGSSAGAVDEGRVRQQRIDYPPLRVRGVGRIPACTRCRARMEGSEAATPGRSLNSAFILGTATNTKELL